MRRLLFALLAVAPAYADDLRGTVADGNGTPVVAADVWLVPFNVVPPKALAHTVTAADGSFRFDKALVGRLWQENTLSQLVAIDATGRLGAVYVLSANSTRSTLRVTLVAASEVRGRVVDTSGTPVPNATVAVRGFEMTLDALNPAREVRLPAEVHDRYRATTGPDGSFTLRGVPAEARVVANVSADSYATTTYDWDARKAADLALGKPATVSGRVVGEPAGERGGLSLSLLSTVGAAKPPVTVKVSLNTRSEADGTFRFTGVPAGRYYLGTSRRPGATALLDARSVEVPAGGDVRVPDWPLVALRPLRGRVVDEDGKGIPGVRVTVARFGGAVGNAQRFIASWDDAVTTDADGRYRGHVTPHAAVGAKVDALPVGYAVGGSDQVVTEDATTVELGPIQLVRAKPIVVRVVDADGKPVAGAAVEVVGPVMMPRPDEAKFKTGPDGTARWSPRERIEAVTLRALTADAVSEPASVDLAEKVESVTLTVSAANAFRVAGRVADRAGKPVVGVDVVVERMTTFTARRSNTLGVGGEYRRLQSAADGTFSAGPFAPADQFRVRINVPDCRPVATDMIAAVAGTTHDFGTLTLVRMNGVVRGRVVDTRGKPIAGAKVVNGGDALRRLATTASADGRFEISNLTVGPVHVVAFADGFRPGRVVADSGRSGDVALTLRRPGEPDATPVEAIDEAAVRRVALDVVRQVHDANGWRMNPLSLDFLARIERADPALAKLFSGEKLPPDFDRLAAEGVDEVLARLGDSDARIALGWLERLAIRFADSDRPKATRFAAEYVQRVRALPPRFRVYGLADAGALLARLGRTDAGRKLVEEAAAEAEKLPAVNWEGYVRGRVLARLAAFDLPRAKRMLEPVRDERDRARYLAMMANVVAETDPPAAVGILADSAAAGQQVDWPSSAARLAPRIASRDPAFAERLLDERAAGTNDRARGLVKIALTVGTKDRATAHRLIDRAMAVVNGRLPDKTAFNGDAVWGETAALVLAAGRAVGYPDRAALTAAVAAERPTKAVVGSETRHVVVQTAMALMTVETDRAVARAMLASAEPHWEAIGTSHFGVGRREYLTAWTLADPAVGRRKMLEALARLEAAGQWPQRPALLDALDALLHPPAERTPLFATWMNFDWSSEDIE